APCRPAADRTESCFPPLQRDSDAACTCQAASCRPPPGATCMADTPLLFTPTHLGDIALSNRIVMAPLTRDRAIAGQVPNPLAVEYYAQRASAGLIIAEGTQINPLGQG